MDCCSVSLWQTKFVALWIPTAQGAESSGFQITYEENIGETFFVACVSFTIS